MKFATLCYIKHDGKTLMLHRVKKADDMHEGKWNGLGGKIKPGESPEECIIREIKEESGLAVKSLRLKGFITFPKFSKDEDWYGFIYTADKLDGEIAESDEGNLEWIDDDKLMELNMWEGDKIFLKWMEEDRFFSAKFIYINGVFKSHQVIFY